MSIEDIAAKVKVCTKCSLCKTRIKAVPGEGNSNAKIMLIGEAPGASEDEQGKPFVGAAGKLLNQMLENAGLKREDVFITNIVKCRPPGNRDPLPEEKTACSPYLDAQIEAIQPAVIVCLGRHSAEYMFSKFGIEFPGITKARGQPRKVDSLFGHFILFPTYHPAATIYNQQLRPVLESDFKVLAGLVKAY
ncbi:MAG: type-4 uracil-DNA glycosylase [Candidatus Micrarchaeia archaeon]